MERFELTEIRITGGYFKAKQDMNKNVTIPATYKQFYNTGRVEAAKIGWQDGMPNRPHIFWDSDMAKWIEGAAYTLAFERDENLEKLIDSYVSDMAVSQSKEGYYNCYFQNIEYANRFTRRNDHELYCAGHLLEGAVAYKKATGKTLMLDVMKKYIDYIYDVFTAPDRKFFTTPGHEEIELALVKLYHETGIKKYLELSRFFIEKRGTVESEKLTNKGWASENYAQDHLPIQEQYTAEGHSVRCLYMFAGAADIAREYKDEKLKAACEAVYDNIVNKRMYVNGGIGGNHSGEAFSYDYDLPNELAYTETCASIAMMFFCERMYLLTGDKKYMDTLELQFYNAVMPGISICGDRFFYCNPLEVHPDRRDYFTKINNSQFAPDYSRPEYFGCSCCPPNVIRIIASIGQYIYQKKDGDLYVNLFNDSEIEYDGMKVSQTTNYPHSGDVTFKIKDQDDKQRILYIRKPDWCLNVEVSGTNDKPCIDKNYIKISGVFKEEATIKVSFDMPVTELYANPKVHYCAGKTAVKRGPIVYCAESVDNGENLQSLKICKNANFKTEDIKIENESAVAVTADAYSDNDNATVLYQPVKFNSTVKRLKLIPYAIWANRGRSEMTVWINKE